MGDPAGERRTISRVFIALLFSCAALGCRPADAQVGPGTDRWRISEVVTALGGDPDAQAIELVLTGGGQGCFFSTTRLELFDEQGNLVASQSPWAQTVCAAGQIYLFATPAAAAQLGRQPDRTLQFELPLAEGQLCFRSSSIRYDCVRWGSVSVPIVDFGGAADQTSASPPPFGWSLSRAGDTNVIEQDFIVYPPSLGSLNPVMRDGDGGLLGPDAGEIPDGDLPDARRLDSHFVDGGVRDGGPDPDAGSDGGPDLDASPRDRAEIVFDGASLVYPDATQLRIFDARSGGRGCEIGVAGRAERPLACYLLLGALLCAAGARHYHRKISRRRSG